MAAALAFRLAKLDAMRRAAEALEGGVLLGRDVFPAAAPSGRSFSASKLARGDSMSWSRPMSPSVGGRSNGTTARPAPGLSAEQARLRLQRKLRR